MPIDDRLATVSQVSCYRDGQQQGTASGFFYMDSDRLFSLLIGMLSLKKTRITIQMKFA